jgi:hypothetical protein
MDELTAFMELSALLTGKYNIVTDREDNALYRPIADEYARRLRAVLTGFPLLLDAYKTLASATPKPAVDDTLLAAFKVTPAFQKNEFAARQIVNIWYFSQFLGSEANPPHFLDGGFYERGAIWPLIKAHPIGFSHKPHGYWTKHPDEEAP